MDLIFKNVSQNFLNEDKLEKWIHESYTKKKRQNKIARNKKALDKK